MWNSHSTLPAASTASPVGFGDVDPSSRPFQPLTKSLHSWRGLSGNGRNSPIVGTDRLMNERLATSTATITASHVIIGASERSRQRRMTAVALPSAAPLASTPITSCVSRARRNDASRLLPRDCRSCTSASLTRRSLAIAPRRASSVGNRGIAPIRARTDAHASRAWPAEHADDDFEDREGDQLEQPHRAAANPP